MRTIIISTLADHLQAFPDVWLELQAKQKADPFRDIAVELHAKLPRGWQRVKSVLAYRELQIKVLREKIEETWLELVGSSDRVVVDQALFLLQKYFATLRDVKRKAGKPILGATFEEFLAERIPIDRCSTDTETRSIALTRARKRAYRARALELAAMMLEMVDDNGALKQDARLNGATGHATELLFLCGSEDYRPNFEEICASTGLNWDVFRDLPRI